MLQIMDELPMTGTGKIRRHVLRDQVVERMPAVNKAPV
jgi:acyl-coenzyme A synthetase/AMP-(fatty) acid ligase